MKYVTQKDYVTNDMYPTKEAALEYVDKAAFINKKHAFLKTLAIGDLLEGTLKQDEYNNLVLQLKQGINLKVAIEGPMVHHQNQRFIVEGVKDQCIAIKVKPEQPLLEKACISLNLPQDETLKACVGHFLEEALPLERQLILNTYYVHKKTHIPFNVLTHLIETHQSNLKPLLDVFKVLTNKPLQQVAGEIQELLVTNFKENTNTHYNTQFQLFKHTFEMLTQKERSNVLTTLTNNHNDLPEAMKKEWRLGEPTTISYTYFKEHQNQLGHCFNTVFDEVFKWDKEKLLDVAKNTASFKESGLWQSYDTLLTYTKKLQTLALPDSVKETLKHVYEPLCQQGKLLNEACYFSLPFCIQEEKKDATLYFCKPKKKHHSIKQTDYLAVLHLDLNHLNTLEVSIHQKDTRLEVDFFVANEGVYRFLSKKVDVLNSQLQHLNYETVTCRCYLKETAPSTKPQVVEVTGLDLKI